MVWVRWAAAASVGGLLQASCSERSPVCCYRVCSRAIAMLFGAMYMDCKLICHMLLVMSSYYYG